MEKSSRNVFDNYHCRVTDQLSYFFPLVADTGAKKADIYFADNTADVIL